MQLTLNRLSRNIFGASGSAPEEVFVLEEKKKSQYTKHVERHACPRCGKPMRDGHVYCADCRAKINAFQRERRAWYIAHGICPLCGKNNLFESERSCIECRAKRANKHKADPKSAERSKERRRAAAENGICTRCLKRPADNGFKMCSKCRSERRRKNMIAYRGSHMPRTEWIEHGVCYLCGKNPIVPGKKVCKECRAILAKNIGKAKEKSARNKDSYWRRTMGTIFGHYREIDPNDF